MNWTKKNPLVENITISRFQYVRGVYVPNTSSCFRYNCSTQVYMSATSIIHSYCIHSFTTYAFVYIHHRTHSPCQIVGHSGSISRILLTVPWHQLQFLVSRFVRFSFFIWRMCRIVVACEFTGRLTEVWFIRFARAR